MFTGWQRIATLSLASHYFITTIAASTNPAHVVYFAASSLFDQPALYRIDEANGDGTRPNRLSLPSAPSGAYVHSFGVNPDDADEVLVVLSNYNIRGLYHTRNGGISFSLVEGNLLGSRDLPGPSLRSATILPFEGTTYYIVGTSTGLYSANVLDGSNTTWVQQAVDLIGNTVVEFVTSRRSDGVIAVATHGRGLFVGSVNQTAIASSEEPAILTLDQNYPNPVNPSTSIPFSLSRTGTVQITLYNIRGREVRKLMTGQRMTAGRYELPVNLSSLAGGLYFYRLEFLTDGAAEPTVSQVRKITVLK